MSARGYVIKYGDHIDTDVIIPARYLNSADPAHLAAHCMEDLDPHFKDKIQAGDILVAGENFGCGSSREHAPVAIKAAGISCVIAKSFARIFYRNSINMGLFIVVCPQAAQAIENGDLVSVDFETGLITNETQRTTYAGEPFPPFIRNIIEAGGLIAQLQARKDRM